MKKIVFCVFLISSIQLFAISNQPVNSSNQQPIVVWGDMNDKSVGAESVASQLVSQQTFVQQQNAISDKYNQKQVEIAAQQAEYFDDMDFGMFGEPYWGDPFDYYPDNFVGPGVVITLDHNNDTEKQKPQMIGYYESQMSNGDILFKQ